MKYTSALSAALLFLLFLLLLAACDAGGANPAPSDADGDVYENSEQDETALDVEVPSEANDESPAEELALPFVTDAQGRVLILHGANVDNAAKSSPYLPKITREEVKRLSADWGFNFVRFLLAWSGVEPSPGDYDAQYLDQVEQRLDWFHEAGLWVMLDLHQDVYSEFTCGNGAPQWAVRTDDLPIECPNQWFLGYFQPGVRRAFDNFWNADGPHGDLQQRYTEMWAAIATRFKDHPAVIAYDLMNEPHPGSDFDAAEALGMETTDSPSPGFDRTKLQPFYQRLIDRIRQIDADSWLAFEPRYGAPGNGSPAFFTALNDPRDGAPRLLYAPHLYSVALEYGQAYDPETDHTITLWETHRKQETAALGAALVVGEWGLGPEWTNAALFMSEVIAMSDRLMAGWSYWAWDPGGWSWLNPDGTERETTNLLVRVYPRRIAGIPERFSYDAATRVFTLAFTDHPSIAGPTEIYLPQRRFYPDGWELLVSDPDGSWSSDWDATREVLSVSTPSLAAGHQIEIRPAAASGR